MVSAPVVVAEVMRLRTVNGELESLLKLSVLPLGRKVALVEVQSISTSCAVMLKLVVPGLFEAGSDPNTTVGVPLTAWARDCPGASASASAAALQEAPAMSRARRRFALLRRELPCCALFAALPMTEPFTTMIRALLQKRQGASWTERLKRNRT